MDCATLHVIHQPSQFTPQMTTSRRAHHAYNVNLLFQYPDDGDEDVDDNNNNDNDDDTDDSDDHAALG